MDPEALLRKVEEVYKSYDATKCTPDAHALTCLGHWEDDSTGGGGDGEWSHAAWAAFGCALVAYVRGVLPVSGDSTATARAFAAAIVAVQVQLATAPDFPYPGVLYGWLTLVATGRLRDCRCGAYGAGRGHTHAAADGCRG